MLFGKAASLEPETVLTWFDVCCAGLRHQHEEALKLLSARLELPEVLRAALPIGASQESIAKYFASSRQELALTGIFTLIAAAEARIRTDAASRMEGTDELARRLKVLRARARTEWAVPLYDGGILDAWKAYVGTLADLGSERARVLSSIGRFKNLLNIRHWVAHGRYWRPVWDVEHYSPEGAADVIQDLFNTLRQVATDQKLIAFE